MLSGEDVAFLRVMGGEDERQCEDGVEDSVLEETEDGVASNAWRVLLVRCHCSCGIAASIPSRASWYLPRMGILIDGSNFTGNWRIYMKVKKAQHQSALLCPL